ncbi:MAG: amidase [Actinobacteria bacterium]|nr:amidase [Actinomycetota bacterium]
MSELTNLDAVDQAGLVASGKVSARELIDAAIAQAEAVNGDINAIIHPRFERAQKEADSGLPAGPFTGVPMVLKDLGAPLVGEPHHMGTRFLKNEKYIASRSSYLTQRFLRAGFVVIGRTNTPEFGNTITTEPLSYGPTRNPWNLEHSTGGSSGGSAASVAAHIVSVGHANDGGGSIRVPASECGLVGLKPSRGRVSKGPDLGETWMGATIDGCVTRTVRDTAAVLDVICGYESGDPYTAPPFARPLSQEVGVNPGRLRIGILDHPLFSYQLDDAESRASVARVADQLTALGHDVSVAWPEHLNDESSAGKFTAIVAAWTHRDVSTFEAILGRTIGEGDLEPDNIRMREMGRAVTAEMYLANMEWLHAWCRRVVQWWEPTDGSKGFDVLVTPTLAGPPPRIGHLSGENGGRNLREIMAYTSQFNLTGQPAISLPLHWSASGLPMGVHFVGAPFREDVLVRLASQLETAMPWSGMVAPLVANP